MKQVLSLLAAVFAVSSLACTNGEETWVPPEASAPQVQSQRLETAAQSEGRTPEAGSTSETCTPAYPPTPHIPEHTNLDTWDFAGTPLLPTTSVTRSLYLVAFESAMDPTRLYVYGIDVGLNRILFTATMSKRYVVHLTQRAGIDIGNFQLSSAGGKRSGVAIEIEGPTPPPPPPNIHDPYVENYGNLAWQVAVDIDRATRKLHL
jgi:hypothetical protein